MTPWTVACQDPLSMGFFMQEYCSGLPFPAPGDLPDAGMEPVSLESAALTDELFITSVTWETHFAEILRLFVKALNKS